MLIAFGLAFVAVTLYVRRRLAPGWAAELLRVRRACNYHPAVLEEVTAEDRKLNAICFYAMMLLGIFITGVGILQQS